MFQVARTGKKLRSGGDAVEVIGDAIAQGADLIVIPVERLDEDFFQLRTGVAGEFIQKFVTYGRRLAIVGDISLYLAESSAFRDLKANYSRQASARSSF